MMQPRLARRVVLGLAALVVVTVAAGWILHRQGLEHQLMAAQTEAIPNDPKLTRLAQSIAAPVYARNCAGCHGEDHKGNPALGAPNLVDTVWLYDQGRVGDIERLILYGARSGLAKSRNITDMPAVGRIGILKPAEIHDVVEYVVQLSKRPADPAASARGAAIFRDKGNCYDCHAPDGTGNPDYGSTDFTSNVWVYGGDRVTLFKSVRDGRHGLMPAFVDKLSPVQIRALAVDAYVRSHRPAGQRQAQGASSPSG